MKKIPFGEKPTVQSRAKAAEDRYGETLQGTAKKAKPSVKVRPSGNPLKGKYGVKIKAEW